jgi:pantothenate kinase type III
MVDSLLTGTSDLAGRWAWESTPDLASFPTNTRDAIEQGCLAALTSLVASAAGRLESPGGQAPRLAVTGGAAQILAPWLPQPAEFIPDLVLQGLARFA